MIYAILFSLVAVAYVLAASRGSPLGYALGLAGTRRAPDLALRAPTIDHAATGLEDEVRAAVAQYLRHSVLSSDSRGMYQRGEETLIVYGPASSRAEALYLWPRKASSFLPGVRVPSYLESEKWLPKEIPVVIKTGRARFVSYWDGVYRMIRDLLRADLRVPVVVVVLFQPRFAHGTLPLMLASSRVFVTEACYPANVGAGTTLDLGTTSTRMYALAKLPDLLDPWAMALL